MFTPLSGSPSMLNENRPAPHAIAGIEGNHGEICCFAVVTQMMSQAKMEY